MSFDSTGPYWNSSDERAQRQRDRVRKKMQQKKPAEELGQGARDIAGKGDNQSPSREDNSMFIQLLSKIEAPQVTAIEARCAVVQVVTPPLENEHARIDPRDLCFELLLSDRGKDAKYKTVFVGEATEVTVNDLKPGTQYHVRAVAGVRDSVKGEVSPAVSFHTLACQPADPLAPKLVSSSKTALKIKWNAGCDNGAKITAYVLEWDKGEGDGVFCEVYRGAGRQHEVSQLQPSTLYTFRLAAVNSMGTSGWSDPVVFTTSGSVPAPPPPPRVESQGVREVSLTWDLPPADCEGLLQMEDESTGHGFMPVYSGPGCSFCVTDLRPNTQYRFRLALRNACGTGRWSEVVEVSTLPDVPAPPATPRVSGRVSSHAFTLTWSPPTHDGGSDVTKYVVMLDNGEGDEVVYEGACTEHRCEGLAPGHKYRARVACCSAGGQSEFSDSCVVTTEPEAPGQCASPSLQGKPKASSLHLRWGPPASDGGSAVLGFAVRLVGPEGEREVYQGRDTHCLVAGLRPGQHYTFHLRCWNKVGTGPWSEPLVVQSSAGVPDAPSPPLVRCDSPHTATISWSPPADNGAPVKLYHLHWLASPGDDLTQLYSGPLLSHEVRGLTPATQYSFTVQAVNSSGVSEFSPLATCVTLPSSPDPPTSVSCRPLTPTSVEVRWGEGACGGSEVTHYTIKVSEQSPVSVSAGEQLEHTVDGLKPDTTYRIQVRAVNGIGAGSYSAAVKVTTPPLPPSAPWLQSVSVTANSTRLKWGGGGGGNSQHLTYVLHMAADQAQYQEVYRGTALTHKVGRLAHSSCYQFRVAALNQTGQGPFSPSLPITTPRAPPPPVKGVQVLPVGKGVCEVRWTPCGGHSDSDTDQLSYILQMQTLTSQTFTEVYRGVLNTHTLRGLSPEAHYQLRVCAVRDATDGACGPFSPIAHFTSISSTTPTPSSTTTPARHAGKKKEKKKKEEGKKEGAGAEREGGCPPVVTEGVWGEKQWACAIMAVMVVVAVVVAVVTQQIIAYYHYDNDNSSSPPLSSSSSPSSSSPPTS